MKKQTFEFEPIGFVSTCFKEKFGIPRQSGLTSHARGVVKLKDDPNLRTALRGIETFSHLWLVFVFHEHGSRNWKPSIRPPRLGGAKKVGVLASRSPHRPNPIGLSAVALEGVDLEAKGGPEIFVRGVDLLDGTPILDVKPYIPYADSLPDANAGWANEPISRIEVEFSEEAEVALALRLSREPVSGSGLLGASGYTNLKALIVEMLELDPRPAFQKRQMSSQNPKAHGTRYGFKLFDFDVKWEIRDGKFWVLDLVNLP